MTDLRLLCLGDNHGDASTLQRVVDETAGEEFDFVIHVGDITNASEDGMAAGSAQLEEIAPLFDDLATRGTIVYIWGNRDFEFVVALSCTLFSDVSIY